MLVERCLLILQRHVYVAETAPLVAGLPDEGQVVPVGDMGASVVEHPVKIVQDTLSLCRTKQQQEQQQQRDRLA